jgi:DNA-binding TFAR19-related protein (PDSD5 family)
VEYSSFIFVSTINLEKKILFSNIRKQMNREKITRKELADPIEQICFVNIIQVLHEKIQERIKEENILRFLIALEGQCH